jgi:hypothetical protein
VKGFAAGLALLAALAAPAAARADFTVTPSTSQAGAHADVTLHATFSQTPSSVVLHLPPGLVGNPNAVPRCPVATFESLAGCPSNTAVGTATATPTIPTPVGGTVYNLVPQAGEPARLGIAIVGLVKNQASIALRPDGGLDSTIAQLDDGGLGLSALDLTLDSSFMTLPTSCQAAVTTISAPPNAAASAAFTPTRCDHVPFAPTIAPPELETTQRVVPSGATISVDVPDGGTIRQSHVKKAAIVLPVGTTLSPGVASGLAVCGDDQFAADACPAASKIGTVSFATPLLDTPLGGSVYFAAPYRLLIAAEGSGVSVKLKGDVSLDPATGQITTVFDNLPQVPFTSFALTFQGGAHAVLANPATCGTKTVTSTLTPWSGGAPAHPTATFTIDADGHGGACTAAAFAPGLSVSAQSTAAGRPAGAVSLAVSRADGSQDIARATTQLPPGLAGSLKGVPVCSDAAADAGTCPAATRVGSVSALAGSGDAPAALSGTVSLTGPTDGGLAGLAIAIPGKVGPVDLGTVVVRASIALRPDGGLTVRTRPLPRIVGGVPVSIRQLTLTFDRPGFILNSSSCAAQQVTAVLDGADGASATVSAPYQATDCAGLRFSPQLQASIGARGMTGPGAHPPIHTVIAVPAGQAATALAKVDLPAGLTVDLKSLSKACSEAAYAANACPASSQIGTATATTPLLATPLSGPVHLAVAKTGDLPGLALALSGPVTLPLFGTVDPSGKQVHTAFSGIPDVPLERFELTFTANGPLRLSRDVCAGARQTVGAQFTGHNGALANVSAPLHVDGCPPIASLIRRGHRFTLRVNAGRDAAAIKSATLRLPSGKTLTLKRNTSFRLAKLSGKRAFRLTVRDAAKQTWKLSLRAKTPR